MRARQRSMDHEAMEIWLLETRANPGLTGWDVATDECLEGPGSRCALGDGSRAGGAEEADG